MTHRRGFLWLQHLLLPLHILGQERFPRLGGVFMVHPGVELHSGPELPFSPHPPTPWAGAPAHLGHFLT